MSLSKVLDFTRWKKFVLHSSGLVQGFSSLEPVQLFQGSAKDPVTSITSTIWIPYSTLSCEVIRPSYGNDGLEIHIFCLCSICRY